jgi:hypothetical protein
MRAISRAVIRFEIHLAVATKIPIIQHLERKKKNYTASTFVSIRHTFFIGNMTTATEWLRAGQSGDRIPMGATFSAPVQTSPGAHPASCTMRTASFARVESVRGVTLTPHPLPVLRSRNRVQLYLYSPKGPSWPMTRVNPTLLRLHI